MRGTLKDIKFIYCSVCKSLITRSLSDGALIIYSSEQRIVSDIKVHVLFYCLCLICFLFLVKDQLILSIHWHYSFYRKVLPSHFFWPKNSWIITSRCQKKLPYLCTQTMHSWYYFSERNSVGQVEVLVIKLNSDIFLNFANITI